MAVVPDCLFYLMLLTFTCDHAPYADLQIIPLFADWVEMKPQDMSVMFQVLNSADVWMLETGIGHALPMSLEARGSAASFCKTD